MGPIEILLLFWDTVIQDGETLDANHGEKKKQKNNTGAQCVGQESRHSFPKISNLPNAFKFHLPEGFQYFHYNPTLYFICQDKIHVFKEEESSLFNSFSSH